MKPNFVKTENVKRLVLGLGALQERGAGEACLMVVDGLPGLGKTGATSWLAAQNDCVFLRAKKEWTPAWFLRELLEQLNIRPTHHFSTMFRQAVEALAARADAAARAGDTLAVILDEVDYISRSDTMLSSVRDLSDMLEIPFILVGMGKVRTNLKRFPQITSRVSQYVEFLPLSRKDADLMLDGLCDVKIQEDLAAVIHEFSKGFVREIKEAIAHVERFANRQGLKAVCLSDMAGQTLMNDRLTSKPIVIRG